jgi:hypothetical protein
MDTYLQAIERLEAELEGARNAVGQNIAAAIAKKGWHKHLRDRFDAAALVDRIDELQRDPQFLITIRAAADRARVTQVRGRGRPKKTDRANATTAKSTKSEATADAGT